MSTASPITHGGKPYICDICGEHRDAHESPPTEVDGELVCEDCGEPEWEVPLREIPSLILELRGRLAQAQTERNQFQRERAEALAALAISRQTVDDLTAHSVAQGDYIARLDIDVRVRDKALDEAARKINRLTHRADTLAEYIEHDIEHHGESTEDPHVRELIEAAGILCDECDGRGWVADEEFIGDAGAKLGFRTRDVRDECGKCDGIGRRLR